jgi:hypothetical protein
MPKIVPRFGDLPVLGPHGFTRVGYTEWGERSASRTGDVRARPDAQQPRLRLPRATARRARRARDRAGPSGRGRSEFLSAAEDYGTLFTSRRWRR